MVDQYLRKYLSKEDYDNLSTKLDMTKNKLTRRLASPSLFTYDDLVLLDEILLEGLRAIDLVDMANAGIDSLTLRQYRLLQAL